MYISVNSTNPSSLFGGTWVAWGAGRVPVGINTSDGDFNTAEKTGGSKTHSHKATTSGAASGTTGSTTLNIDQIPAHNHSVDNGSGGVLTWPRNQIGWGWHDGGWNNDAIPNVEAIKTTQNAGGNQGHTHSLNGHTHSIPASSGNNMPPYITCYMWRRTA